MDIVDVCGRPPPNAVLEKAKREATDGLLRGY